MQSYFHCSGRIKATWRQKTNRKRVGRIWHSAKQKTTQYSLQNERERWNQFSSNGKMFQKTIQCYAINSCTISSTKAVRLRKLLNEILL